MINFLVIKMFVDTKNDNTYSNLKNAFTKIQNRRNIRNSICYILSRVLQIINFDRLIIILITKHHKSP